ncbi:hypothetical protein, partial [Mesorhizobium sp. M1E.F.Ca.ET.063.01.1.1]|uniref:hypothetical protein n=1 Tax=Mesorhizobium sp. M1E.F.Ca.ET.063.01.1.1 TaxID=2496750 RepID=UPI001AEC9722
ACAPATDSKVSAANAMGKKYLVSIRFVSVIHPYRRETEGTAESRRSGADHIFVIDGRFRWVTPQSSARCRACRPSRPSAPACAGGGSVGGIVAPLSTASADRSRSKFRLGAGMNVEPRIAALAFDGCASWRFAIGTASLCRMAN